MPDQGSEGLFSPYLRKKRIAACYPFLYGRILDVGCSSGELAAFVPTEKYLGVDTDKESLKIAKIKYPHHRFKCELPNVNTQFDTIASLAVIEHVDNPDAFLHGLAELLTPGPKSRIILTSPHPIAEEMLYLGSRIRLFSRSANEEHTNLLSQNDFLKLAAVCDLRMSHYRRFLFGINQLVVYQKTGLDL